MHLLKIANIEKRTEILLILFITMNVREIQAASDCKVLPLFIRAQTTNILVCDILKLS